MTSIIPSEQQFFTFIYKRQLIWHKRFILKQKPPWTQDKVLQTFKFINMYRELDRCTIYIINKLQHIQNRKQLLINIIFYRFFNLDNLYKDLGIEPFPAIDEELKNKLIGKFNELKKTGPIFNNAYLISSGGSGVKHINILNNLAKLDIKEMITKIDDSKNPEESFSLLKEIPMVGPFLACEFWTDLTYFNFFKQGWTDDDFVNIGPGAQWGLEILYGRLSGKEMMEKLYDLHEKQKEILPNIHRDLNEKLSWQQIAYRGAYSNYPFLSLTNIEGALCEFRKYWNLSHGKGRKRYYKPIYYSSSFR